MAATRLSSSMSCLSCASRSSAENILSRNRGLIAVHDVGTGKTLTAVTAAQCFLDESPQHKVIVITPVSLQNNFIQTLDRYGIQDKDKERFHFFTIQGFSNAKQKGQIKNFENSMLILDEAHNIRTCQSDPVVEEPCDKKKVGIYAKSLIDAGRIVKRVLLLTATPLINSPLDIINLIAIVNGEQQISQSDFDSLDLKRWLRRKISIYSPSPEFLREKFPRVIHHNIFLEMNPKYYRQYMRVEDAPYDDEKAFYNGLRRYSNTSNRKQSVKADWIIKHIRDSQHTDKFVVFSHYIGFGIDIVMNQLKIRKIPYKSITGLLSKKDRQDAVTQYNNGTIKVLLISKAGSEGLDLKNTSGIIIMEPAWNQSSIEQIIGRGVRLESHHSLPPPLRKVDIYHLYMIKPEEKDNIDAIYNNLDIINPVDNSKLSVDIYMRNVSIKKQEKINEFIEFIKGYSIEKYNIDDYVPPT
jgi:hypothetical protein